MSNEEVVALVRAVTAGDLPIDVGAYPLQPPDTTYWVADIKGPSVYSDGGLAMICARG